MRIFLTIGAALFALATANAAKAQPPATTAAHNWTGVYIGANLGYGLGETDDNISFVDPLLPFAIARSQSDGLNGVIGGAQLGYNWQFSPHAVLGLEADWQSTSHRASRSFVDLADLPFGVPPDTEKVATNYEDKISWFGTLRGRVGYAWDSLLLYGTGGLAYARVGVSGAITETTDLTNTGAGIFTSTTPFSVWQTKAGWTAGAGIESAIADNWTWKIEYLYIDLGSTAGTFPVQTFVGVGEALSVRNQFTDNILRAGLNFRFR